jgi:nitroreductase
MTIKELVHKNRSYRRFDQTHVIKRDLLVSFVDLARMSPFGGNVQSLRFILTTTDTDKVFETLGWAKYLTDWDGPRDGERPTAYITILNDPALFPNALAEAGIAAQSILLGATSMGLGGCIFRNINKIKLAETLNISDKYEILMVLAVGKPTEQIKIVEIPENGDIKYWRDNNSVHHVPKRKLEDLII